MKIDLGNLIEGSNNGGIVDTEMDGQEGQALPSLGQGAPDAAGLDEDLSGMTASMITDMATKDKPTEFDQGAMNFDEAERLRAETMTGTETWGKDLLAAAREVIPGLREIMDDRPVFTSLEFDEDPNFDHNSEDAQAIYKELGEEYYDDLNEAKSLKEMMNTRDQINAANADMQYMTKHHGVVGSMGLYMAASLADPVSWVAYGGLGKFYQIASVADKLSKAGRLTKASITAGAAAGIEGASEYYIQSHGARHYESVGATMLFASVLGGGGHLMLDTLKSKHSVRQQEAFDKLTEGGVTLKSDPVQARALLDEALANDELSAYRSVIAKGLSKLLPQRLQFSPGMIAWQRGGSISALAHLFDTLPGLSTKGEHSFKAGDNHIFEPKLKDGRTAMDVKYEAMEDFVQYEYARIKAYKKHVSEQQALGNKPMTKEEFSSATWREVNTNYARYITKKRALMSEIRQDEMLMEELRAGLNDKLINDPFYLKKDTMAEKEKYRDEQLENEVDALARDKMVHEPEYQVSGHNEALNDMVEASSTYYKNMQERLVKSGIRGSEYFDPRFHMPRMYNKDRMRGDVDGAKAAMQKAIEESVEYKEALSKTFAELHEAIGKVNDPNAAKDITDEIRALEEQIDFATEEIRNLENILNDVTIPDSIKASVLRQRVRLTQDLAAGRTQMVVGIDGNSIIVKYSAVSGDMKYMAVVNGETFRASKMDFDEGSYEHLTRKQIKETFDAIDGHKADNEPVLRDAIRKIVKENPVIMDLMKATGKTLDDMIGTTMNRAFHNPPTGNIGIGARALDHQVVIHELLHTLTTEALATNKAFFNEIKSLRQEVIDNYWEKGGLRDVLDSNGIPFDLKMGKDPIELDGEMIPHVFDNGTTLGHRISYMLGLDKEGIPQDRLLGEFISVGLSNPHLAKVLNEVRVKDPVTSKNVSVLSRLRRALQNYLGIKRVAKESVFGQMFQAIEKNAKSVDVGHLKNKREYLDIEAEIKAKERELDAIDNRTIVDTRGALQQRVDRTNKQKEIEELGKKAVAARNKIVDEISATRKSIEDDMGKQIAKLEEKKKKRLEGIDANLKAKLKEHKRVKAYPKKAAAQSVENIIKQDNLQQFGLASNTPTVLKGRKLTLDPLHMEGYMRTDEASISQAYHYGTSGRLAVGHATGFTDPKEFRKHLEENSSFDKKDMQVAMDLFELTLGTRQIPHDYTSNWEKGIRMMKSFNYVTMGGQFAKYGMSEIGAGVYAGGFNYLKELIPALRTTKRMYKGQNLDVIEEDMIRMAEASEIWQNNARTKYADIDNIESTFSGGVEEKLNWMSHAMFRLSGLEGISTLTKVALPRAFLGRIIRQAQQGRGSYDLIRWGIGIEDMAKVAEQPVIRNEKGQITDFNFDKWDADVAEKFQLATTRMARDGILRPDAIRIPNWINDGGQAWMWRLAGQFLSFAAMANERLFLRGLSENRRMALIGSMVSMGILAAFEKASEEVAVSLGILDEDKQRYDFESEDGVENLMKAIATRSSFVGAPHFYAEQLIAYNSFNGSDRVLSQLGGPSAGRAMVMAKAAKEFGWEGKVGTAAQVHTLKSMIPFINLIGVDSFVKNMTGDIKSNAKDEDYYRFDALKEMVSE